MSPKVECQLFSGYVSIDGIDVDVFSESNGRDGIRSGPTLAGS